MFSIKNGGIGLMLYGIAAFVMAQNGIIKGPLDTNWYTQLFATIGGGAGLVYMKDLASLKAWLNRTFNSAVLKPVETTIAVTTTSTDTSKFNTGPLALEDFQSISYLAERLLAAKDLEGVKLCKDLNAHLFDVHHVAEKSK